MSSLRKYWRRYRQSSGLEHEFMALALCLAIGLIVMPTLIWFIGSAKLGPYAGGGLPALWRDYFLSLLKGSLAYWLVALGPYAGLWLLRGARYGLRR